MVQKEWDQRNHQILQQSAAMTLLCSACMTLSVRGMQRGASEGCGWGASHGCRGGMSHGHGGGTSQALVCVPSVFHGVFLTGLGFPFSALVFCFLVCFMFLIPPSVVKYSDFMGLVMVFAQLKKRILSFYLVVELLLLC